jgi:hypothetical protein
MVDAAADGYELRPNGWVESPLRERDDAPKQGVVRGFA